MELEIARVALSGVPYSADKLYSYLVPPELADACRERCRQLRTLLEREQPGVSRMIDLRTERFNQHTSPGALLLEIGSAGDTLTEALAAARLVGQAVASLLALA